MGAENVNRGVEQPERTLAYRVLRYTSNLVRDEWVNIGVLLFDPQTSERRLRLIEEPEEFRRVRHLHPQADEDLLRALRDDLENRFVEYANAATAPAGGAPPAWQQLLAKWDDTLSNALQLAPQKGVLASDLDLELERLYTDHVAPQRGPSRVGAPGSRASIRDYCNQVLRQAQIWNRLEKSVRVSRYTFTGDPMRIDYGYRSNGTHGFIQTLSVTRAPSDAKLLAYTAERIAAKEHSQFACVTDVELLPNNERHQFVAGALRDANIQPVSLDHFAVWVNELKPLMRVQ